ncbi:rod shape-determining protein [Pontibacter chinhatensis]|uniref:Cell shape-determining protein MreB n=1 Tax=Pontibacter chinhatensis TaxID=1436961 RepID=A0A1I2XKJ8_9BACT|nr:rod shape-determining protein [Pontibacter chinhatensis]SFH13970.1 rod shape-determining protein MreB [Pontibacter chinhatensis]
MSLFNFFTEEVAIDLGTANCLVIRDGKVVVNEPSVVAINRNTGEVLAIGREALQMEGKTHEDIRVVRPLKDGVIADFGASEHMIKGMLRLATNGRKRLAASYKMVICVPSGITEVEKRAIRDAATIAGAKELYLVYEPLAAAVGIGLDVEEPTGHMIVDIGGGTTEIAVIALSGIVCDHSLRVAGENFDADIMHFMRRQYNMMIGQATAEKIKIQVGAALSELQDPPENIFVKGRDLLTGLPKQVEVAYVDVAHCLDRSLSKIEEAILKTLEVTPPELAADIHQEGIYLTGGGALLRGLDKRISAKTRLPTHVVEEPLQAVVRGTSIALKNVGKFMFLMR